MQKSLDVNRKINDKYSRVKALNRRYSITHGYQQFLMKKNQDIITTVVGARSNDQFFLFFYYPSSFNFLSLSFATYGTKTLPSLQPNFQNLEQLNVAT